MPNVTLSSCQLNVLSKCEEVLVRQWVTAHTKPQREDVQVIRLSPFIVRHGRGASKFDIATLCQEIQNTSYSSYSFLPALCDFFLANLVLRVLDLFGRRSATLDIVNGSHFIPTFPNVPL